MRAATVPYTAHFVLFLNALPYIGVWWLALRIVLGKRFERLEWIPLGIAAFGIPAALLDFVRPPWLGEALAGAWDALPAAVMLGESVRQCREARRSPQKRL